MAEFKTIAHTLLYPIPVGEKTYSTFIMTEPDVEALEKVEDLGVFNREPLKDASGAVMIDEDGDPVLPPLKVSEVRKLLVILGDLPEEVVLKMHPRDFNIVGKSVGPLLAGYRDTSEKDPPGNVENASTNGAPTSAPSSTPPSPTSAG